MITCLIFSKDRAMQLDAALRSFFLHCSDAKTARLIVIFKTSADLHARQYDILRTDYPTVEFVAEQNFRRDVFNAFNPFQARSAAHALYKILTWINYVPAQHRSLAGRISKRLINPWRVRIAEKIFSFTQDHYAVFLVDDALFVQRFALNECADALTQHKTALGFSLRLGKNITYSYVKDRPEVQPSFAAIQPNVLNYLWSDATGAFGYPLEVSSSMYPAQRLLPVLATLAFNNPNQLESAMMRSRNRFRADHPALLCFQRSVAFCNPINIVQHEYDNRAGNNPDEQADALAIRFERGERIDINAYNGFEPRSCHQEVELRFIT
jgi:hypothetical protein